jgi:hypothetical protein
MAIKGKSKKRGGAGRRAAVAPKPVVVERRPPFLARPAVKRTMLVVLIVAVVLGGLRVWQNMGRANALKTYDRRLTRAQGLLTTHVDPSTITSISRNSSDFASGKLTAKQFLDLAKQWEADFNTTKTDIAKLKGPSQLGDAQALIVQGVDGYIGMARLYQVAAQQQQMADATAAAAKTVKDAAARKTLEARAKAERDQVQVLMLHADEARRRADAIYDLGTAKLNALKREWGVGGAVPAPNGQFPNGGVQVPGQ